jgi:hypothetical protein
MQATRNTRPLIAAALILGLLVMGCDFFEGLSESAGSQVLQRDEERREMEARELEERLKALERHKAESDQVLAAGTVLSVRVNYGKSGASQCRVRIDNERNDWYDYVEWTAHASGSSLGNAQKPYDDYDFGAENFNQQITNPNNAPSYTPEAVEGEYRITVTADTGFSATTDVTWDGEQFNPSLLSFSLE